jgi:hypothetical protein
MLLGHDPLANRQKNEGDNKIIKMREVVNVHAIVVI